MRWRIVVSSSRVEASVAMLMARQKPITRRRFDLVDFIWSRTGAGEGFR
jgi:hypothetical protein